jgi:biotin synthase
MTLTQKLLHADIETISDTDLQTLLTAEGDLQQDLFHSACNVRRENAGDTVILRGVIEISNICTKQCDYCAMRTANQELHRYQLSGDDILVLAQQIKRSGIGTVFLQGGQNPQNDPLLRHVIPIITRDLSMRVLLCLGERPRTVYEEFVRLGADSYILKFETSTPELYRKLAHAQLSHRLQRLRWAQEAGLKVGTGNIVGLPDQTLQTLTNDIRLGISLRPDFISSSPFIPSASTPLQHQPPGSINLTLNTMAIWRIALRTPAIPAVSALEILQKGGQTQGLAAGANVLTINFTPKETQSLYKIYSEQRFVVSLEHALRTAAAAGMTIGHAA